MRSWETLRLKTWSYSREDKKESNTKKKKVKRRIYLMGIKYIEQNKVMKNLRCLKRYMYEMKYEKMRLI